MISRRLVSTSVAVSLLLPHLAAQSDTGSSRVRSLKSAVTVDLSARTVQAGLVPRPPNDQSYDLAIIRFKDDAALVANQELTAAAACITHARQNPNGAVVVLFIHGWHHNSEWDRQTDGGDSHFRSFRELLARLTRREAERYFGNTPRSGGRRIVGIYIGWDGDPATSLVKNVPGLMHGSFYNRYRAAEMIGRGKDLQRTIRTIVSKTKEPLLSQVGSVPSPLPESQLILAGHSMGALMLESAFLALLKEPGGPLTRTAADKVRGLEIRRADQLVSFPDAVIALNSAADSVIHKAIRKELAAQQLTKTIPVSAVRYAPPLLIAATSLADNDTKSNWEKAKILSLSPGRMTDGHDPSLFTHHFTLDQRSVRCDARGFVDFGQNWHCLRRPEPFGVPTPRVAVDLPTRDRTGREDRPPFARYRLIPTGDPERPQLTWVFQLPAEVVADHNDIFNSRASSLILALIQISGAVMSLAEDWQSTFEP